MGADLAARFAALFAGRGDAWGAVHGQSMKERITLNLFQEHLFGEGSVGVYPLLDNGTVHWGCIDVDEGYEASLPIATNLRKALQALGITSWIERTKGKGYHIWTLCSDWVPAEDMIGAQRVACQIVDYTPKEVNPKQAVLDPAKPLGNYVNLPYAKMHADQGKRVVLPLIPQGGPLPLEFFVEEAEASLNSPGVIAKAAVLYKPPPPPKPVRIARPTSDPAPRLRGVARKLWEEGPLPSLTTGRVDRSAALQRLAYLCRNECDLSAGEAYYLVADLDARLGKYVGRSDADLQYQKIIQRAYG